LLLVVVVGVDATVQPVVALEDSFTKVVIQFPLAQSLSRLVMAELVQPLVWFLDLLEAIQYLVVWRRLAAVGVHHLLRALEVDQGVQVVVALHKVRIKIQVLERLVKVMLEEMELQVLEARGMQEVAVALEDLVWMRHRQVEVMAALVFRFPFQGRRCIMPVAVEAREPLTYLQHLL